ncbi:hypothetical protein GCM10009555_043360 [Acrocarpospora macrocephala]|uniref:Uncharacterized protein n=1 Tax=Acrocarpospora macrocephala TaxID=150177 RepID=A0A5M3WIM7_9ACTN|nr:hypothetical protein Amac_005960 [Acrocarpospora macrocephala]
MSQGSFRPEGGRGSSNTLLFIGWAVLIWGAGTAFISPRGPYGFQGAAMGLVGLGLMVSGVLVRLNQLTDRLSSPLPPPPPTVPPIGHPFHTPDSPP